jgi:PAS domain S-box-containing protein
MIQDSYNYREMLQTSPQAIIVIERDGKVLVWNHAAEKIFGWKSVEVIGYEPPFLPHDKEAEAKAVRARVLSGETVTGFETYRLTKSGNKIQIRFSAAPFRNRKGEIAGLMAMIEDITLRNTLNSVMDNMLEGCQILGFDWKYKYVNDALVRDSRITKERLLGHTMAECFPGIETTEMFSVLRECMEKRIPRKFRNEFTFDNNDRRWFDLSIQPVQEGLFVLSLDVTDQKNAEEALLRRESELKESQELARMASWRIDIVTKEIHVSDNYYKIFKINKDGPVKFEEIESMIHPDDTSILNPDSYDRKEISWPVTFDFRTIMPDKTIKWFQNSMMPEYKEGRIIALKGTNLDITEKKQREEEIRKINDNLEQRIAERTAELSDLYNNAPCGYHSLDNKGFFVSINDTELNWLGYEKSEILNHLRAVDIMTPESRVIFHNSFQIFKDSGFIENLELDYIRKDGSILSVLLNATALYENGSFMRSRSTIIDNTERKKSQESLRIAMAGVEEANRELEAFTYSVSHDLRAPLRAIGGFARILEEDYQPHMDEEGQRICNVIKSSSEKMGRLIDDLLAFSRFGRSSLNITNIAMGDIVKNVTDDLLKQEKSRRIEINIGDLPEVKVDPSLIKQVWTNLISNAIKYTSRNKESIIEISSKNDEYETVFYVKDNGIGFDMQYSDKLFEVFQRLHTDREFEGTGVGLAIVKRIVKKHGGRVWAVAEPNNGAVFYFTIPK